MPRPTKKPDGPLGKVDIVKTMAADLGLSQKQATQCYEWYHDFLAAQLLQKGVSRVANLGRFYVTTLSARDAVNPATGEKIHVGERQRVKFEVGTSLKGKLAEAIEAGVKVPSFK